MTPEENGLAIIIILCVKDEIIVTKTNPSEATKGLEQHDKKTVASMVFENTLLGVSIYWVFIIKPESNIPWNLFL